MRAAALLPGATFSTGGVRRRPGPMAPAQISQYAASPIRYGQPPGRSPVLSDSHSCELTRRSQNVRPRRTESGVRNQESGDFQYAASPIRYGQRPGDRKADALRFATPI